MWRTLSDEEWIFVNPAFFMDENVFSGMNLFQGGWAPADAFDGLCGLVDDRKRVFLRDGRGEAARDHGQRHGLRDRVQHARLPTRMVHLLSVRNLSCVVLEPTSLSWSRSHSFLELRHAQKRRFWPWSRRWCCRCSRWIKDAAAPEKKQLFTSLFGT